MSITFNGNTKIATLSTGTITLSVIDLYSRWVDWLLVSDNSKFPLMFSTVGGNTIDAGAGTSIPTYLFLQNGWRIKPQEANHTLSVTGGVLLVSSGGDPFLDTNGTFVVRINYSQPVQAVTVSTGTGTSITVADIESSTVLAKEATVLSRSTQSSVNAITAGGLTTAQSTMLLEMYNLLGLDPAKPLIVTANTRRAGAGIIQTIATDPSQTVVTRI